MSSVFRGPDCGRRALTATPTTTAKILPIIPPRTSKPMRKEPMDCPAPAKYALDLTQWSFSRRIPRSGGAVPGPAPFKDAPPFAVRAFFRRAVLRAGKHPGLVHPEKNEGKGTDDRSDHGGWSLETIRTNTGRRIGQTMILVSDNCRYLRPPDMVTVGLYLHDANVDHPNGGDRSAE